MQRSRLLTYVLAHSTAFLIGVFVLVLIGGIIAVRSYNAHVRDSLLDEIQSRESMDVDLIAPTDSDRIYGARNATMYLIMYSDADCQYCRSLYPKLKRVVESYPSGIVSFVYRYLPLYSQRGTIDESERAGMCVWRETGDEGFFAFHDHLFELLPEGVETSNIESSLITESAEAAGVEVETLNSCLESGFGEELITADHRSGGSQGIIYIPHTFLLSELGAYPIPRDQSEASFRSAVDYVLNARMQTNVSN